jgi:anaerobic ribonucleoside-triphosphate reductase
MSTAHEERHVDVVVDDEVAVSDGSLDEALLERRSDIEDVEVDAHGADLPCVELQAQDPDVVPTTAGIRMDEAITVDEGEREKRLKLYMDEDEILGLHRRLASKLFRLVRKRSGKIVQFDRKKITTAIFKAAEEVGGKDREIAERLTDEVLLYLYSEKGDNLPEVEEIQDAIEKILVERGHARTAKAFILYRDRRHQARRKEEVRDIAGLERKRRFAKLKDATDIAVFVRTSEDDMIVWDRERIIETLVREAQLDVTKAEKISREVEDQIILSNTKVITAPLIRELVDAKLVEHGLESARRKHTRLGVPLYDAERIILTPNKENANIPHNPEATNMTLAESVKKQYALLEVFSQEVSDAHARGDIHLHDLGFIDRPYCSGQSLEYVKKFGLSLPNALSIAKPAKHPEILLAHMVKFSAALQGHFAGAIGWDAVNVFFAPFLEGLSDRDIHQLAEMLIFEYSQQSVARGGQAIFSDINIYWETPKHFRDVMAIGPGGKHTGRTYQDYQKEAQRFAFALFDVYKQGDGTGRPFFFPKPLVHITDEFFRTPGHEEFLLHISDVAADKGNTYFVFDRGETAKISECCRLSFKLEQSDFDDAKEPWRMRYSALQNVTLNLPRAAYYADGDDAKLFEKLDDILGIAVKAHKTKKELVERLLAMGDRGPLALLTMAPDGQAYLRMHRVTYLIGLLGLNEMVHAHLGCELHESEEAFRFGLKVIAHLKLACDRFSKEAGMRFVLEQTPAESTAYRMARLDLEHFPEDAEKVVKGNIDIGEVYYTNSTFLNISHPVSPIERVKKEGMFHDMIEAGALSHVWIADTRPSAEAVASFVKKTFTHTRNAQIAFSPEFTTCNTCMRVTRGLVDTCPYCESSEVDGITRVTGYFSKTSGWNKGKKGELDDRFRSKV